MNTWPDVSLTVKDTNTGEVTCRFCGNLLTAEEVERDTYPHSLLNCIVPFILRFEEMERRVAELEAKQPMEDH